MISSKKAVKKPNSNKKATVKPATKPVTKTNTKTKSNTKRSPKQVKTTKASTTKSSKKNPKDDFRTQNIIALFLLVFGMVFLLSMTTNALGPAGMAIRAILMGQFARLAMLIALVMMVIGTARLVYSSKFSLHSISPIMVLLLFLASMIFYGASNLEIVIGGTINFSALRLVFIQSIVGKSIGIWPYMTAFGLEKIMGKAGMYIASITMFLFVAVYYFRITFSKIGDASIAIAHEGKKAASGIKRRTIEYVTIDEDNPKPKREKRVPEKLDDTRIENKFSFMERYKSEVAEFTEFTEEQQNQEEDFSWGEEAFQENGYNHSGQNQLDDKNQVVADEETINKELFPEYSQSVDGDNAIEESGGLVLEHLDKDGEIHDLNEEAGLEERGQSNYILEEYSPKELSATDLEQGVTKKYVGLSAAVLSKSTLSEVEQEVVDQRIIHQQNIKEKENLDLPSQDITLPKTSGTKSHYVLPSANLLKNYKIKQKEAQTQLKNSQKLESTLEIFGIEAKVVNVSVGPTITRFELQPKMGVKVSKILNLSDDLALALAAVAPIRIEAPIPGTSLIGIELPNAETDVVGFRSILDSDEFLYSKAKLPVALGKDVSGKPIVEDIAKMPHVLVAGATGSGKSVCINTIICSILFKSNPSDVKLIMIDPKMVELSVYNNIPHLLVPVVTDMKKAPYALSWAVNEMNNRYKLFTENRVRDLDSYNSLKGIEKLPRIVIVVDELADLMMVSPNDVEDAIIRLAQKARACGMHLVIATQRPSVDVITGLIKANIPTRIAFAVSSQVDSRTILDQVGAEKLIGKGDMLYSHQSTPKPQRIQGSFITDSEVNRVVDFILDQGLQTESNNDLIEETIKKVEMVQKEDEKDPLLDEITDFAIENKQISTSLVQRRFRIGYNRASRIIDQMEEMGIVSESDGAKPRRVLISANPEAQMELD